jgi:predicted 3-demethylubiquinone-9 3-methyltransferase (glyoxalase superfamily)
MAARQRLTPHLWYDKEAKEAAELYISTLGDSRLKSVATIHDTPSGSADIVTVDLLGQEFTLLNAGPYFKFTPAVSFLVSCRSAQEVEERWRRLGEGGTVLMELGKYPFSEKYGWLQDRYGLSWQLGFMGGEQSPKQRITPMLMFVGRQCGRTEEAVRFYASVFRDSGFGPFLRYEKGEEPDRPGTVKYAAFRLEGQELAAMDSAHQHDFTFNEAVSLMVHCRTQEEIDYYWDRLSADPAAEQCGWLKDKFGLSWQVVPDDMDRMLERGDKEQVARVTRAFLQMKKFDLAALRRAYEGR